MSGAAWKRKAHTHVMSDHGHIAGMFDSIVRQPHHTEQSSTYLSFLAWRRKRCHFMKPTSWQIQHLALVQLTYNPCMSAWTQLQDAHTDNTDARAHTDPHSTHRHRQKDITHLNGNAFANSGNSFSMSASEHRRSILLKLSGCDSSLYCSERDTRCKKTHRRKSQALPS